MDAKKRIIKQSERLKARKKLTLQHTSAVILLVVGCAMLIAGFVAPPLGVIHHSVLIAFGEVLTFVGAVLGIDYNYKYKLYTKDHAR